MTSTMYLFITLGATCAWATIVILGIRVRIAGLDILLGQFVVIQNF